MMMKLLTILFVVLSLIIRPASGQTVIGAAVAVTADIQSDISYIAGPTLHITVNKDAQVTLSLYTAVSINLPAGFQALSFGANVGFQLEISPSDAVIVSASLSTPAITTSAAALVTGTVDAGCLHLDTGSSSYSNVAIQSYNLDRTISVKIPRTGVYLFVAISQTATLPAVFGQSQDVQSNDNRTYSYPQGLFLTVDTTTDASMNVNYADTPSDSSGKGISGYQAVSGFFSVDLQNSNSFQAVIQWKYSDANVGAAVESSLKFAFYNTATSTWEFPSGGGSIDTTANIVSQSTSHFSEWTVMASSADSLAPAMLVIILTVMLM